ncbi:MAG: penicillin-binding protein 2 [Candidatus Paracaedibacteraceae bacterium]|nr:penicillin-binding protein 2 [Candidatus Paracaedibacteraceae bacterium]
MKRNDFYQIFTRRTFLLSAFKGGLMLTLLGRLYYLQVFKGRHYKVLSDKNRIQTCLLAPSRGLIKDKNDIVLAGHKINYQVILVPELVDFPEKLLRKIADLLALSHDHYDVLVKRFKRNKKQNLLVKEGLSWDELSKIELHSEELKGILIEKGERRFYPFPELTCHTLGYVAVSSQKDKAIEGASPLLQLPGFCIGKSGIELAENSMLQGKAGLKQIEVNAYGRTIRTLETFEPIKGEELKLTLDIKLQQTVSDILKREESAGAVIMDVHTGAILALASQPTFNAQFFTDSISKSNWHEIINHPRHPLTNKVISGLYAPGSIFKIVVALAALHEKIVDSHTSFNCPGHYDYNDHRFHCWNWKRGGHGSVNLQSAITQSCDTFFFNIATKLGIDAIAKMARKLGYGEATGIDLAGEKCGLVPSKDWKREKKRQAWTGGDTINASIGQGYLLSTPLQQARMTAMLVNGLKPIVPHLIQKNNLVTLPPLFSIDPDHLALVTQGMSDVVNQPWGTAYRSRIQDSSFLMAGKTASTQVSRITAQQRLEGTHNDRPYELREHAMFTAFAPVEKPRYSVAVIVEHGGSASRVAAPIARDILMATHEREKNK